MYCIIEKVIGYIVETTDSLEEARLLKKVYGRQFIIEDEDGNIVK